MLARPGAAHRETAPEDQERHAIDKDQRRDTDLQQDRNVRPVLREQVVDQLKGEQASDAKPDARRAEDGARSSDEPRGRSPLLQRLLSIG